MSRLSPTSLEQAKDRLRVLLPICQPGSDAPTADLGADVSRALTDFNQAFPVTASETERQFRIRHGFIYLSDSAPVGSDRKAPPRKDRPPAGKITASRGVTLQLLLVMLAARQLGGKAAFDAIAVAGGSESLGWNDLVATGAVNSHSKNGFVKRQEKRLSSVRSSLAVLRRERFVSFDDRVRSDKQVVTLLNEVPPEPRADVQSYQPPKVRNPGDSHFTLPWSFFRQGWVYILRDSELQVLMMLACRLGSLMAGEDVALGEVAIPGEVRLGHYGIHRDPFSQAYINLERFGLIEVREMSRYDSGRAIDGRTQLHRFKLIDGAFDRPALESARAGLEPFGSPAAIAAR